MLQNTLKIRCEIWFLKMGDYRELKPTASVYLLAIFSLWSNLGQKLFNSRNAFLRKAAPGSRLRNKKDPQRGSFILGRLPGIEPGFPVPQTGVINRYTITAMNFLCSSGYR